MKLKRFLDELAEFLIRRARWLAAYPIVLLAGLATLLMLGVEPLKSPADSPHNGRVWPPRAENRLGTSDGPTKSDLARFEAAVQRLRAAEARLQAALISLETRQESLVAGMKSGFVAEVEDFRLLPEVQDTGTLRGQEAAALAGLETLRQEVRDELNDHSRRIKQQEEVFLQAISDRSESVRRDRERFKRTFVENRGSILFVRTEYEVKFFPSEETRKLSGFGTAFFISPVGVGMTAQHVLFPWLYDERLQALKKLGLAEVQLETVTVTMWLTGTRVVDDRAVPPIFFAGAAYQKGGGREDIRYLHVAKTNEVTQVVPSPLGAVEVTMPRLGKGDLVVFQILDFERRFSFVPLAKPGREVGALDEIMVMGYPLSRLQNGMAVPQPSRGRVRRVGPDILELDSPLHPGNSGGPILNGQGRVVGLASAILDSPVYGVALRAREMRAAWEGVRKKTRDDQLRLLANGCDPGPIDGVPGKQTWEARRCEQRRLDGLAWLGDSSPDSN